jgi:hypothetical protein
MLDNNSMKPESIERYIDERINRFIDNGKSFDEVIEFLNKKIDGYIKDDEYSKIRKKSLILNWNCLNTKSKFMSMYVIHSKKRIKDINWIMTKDFKYSNKKLFKLIVFKDKMSKNYT